ncbi:Rap30/74 interaction domain-containing protein [Annulohypoxylon maeteangense]|uniref:Rap30/74 interaction domain-containing protein n=1 Tax=Annulohypoxylon maeteangense TaxID=1927788 RepID=UPI0020079191|nr:Rap30/74 interaction domain-containing protein [Annulohypoxylon maeteangense]KAI0889779.1 Rap30/74 interaction domain-containing protein [Annulohypoxylon maeteangense]
MSATPSPAGGPNGQKPTPPSGAPPLRRPRRPANPLRPFKRPQNKAPPSKVGNGHAPSSNTAPRPGGRPQQNSTQSNQDPQNFEALRAQNGGWSDPPPPGCQEYPLFLTKKSFKEGIRFHVMRFAPHGGKLAQPGGPGVDPTNMEEFTRPVTLHRRDPRQPPPGREVKEDTPMEEEKPEDIAEAERIAQVKAQREAQRAAENAQKAPVTKDLNPKKQQQQQEKTKKQAVQIHHAPRSEDQKKQQEIRYEEALPWHLEDADGKNVWVGQYEGPLSDCKVALLIHNKGFRMMPLEKWYKFASKRGSFKIMSIEEAEKAMNKKVALGRWAVRDNQRQEAEKAMAESRAIVNGRPAVKLESGTFRQASRHEKIDHDDIDMSGDEFQDDDETAGYEPDRDEDTKTAKNRIRRDQLAANLFGEGDEIKVEKEEEDEKKEEYQLKLFGKSLKKALKRRDKQFQYDDSDSDRERNPFASSEDESDSDDDNEKDDEDKKADKDKDGGSTSKGASTPQGKKAAAEAAKKGKSLKRPGSPIVSDSSGTESTRKKKKTTHGSRDATPLTDRRLKPGAGSTSDGEATAGEMSDGAGGKKKRLAPPAAGGIASSRGTPAGSRAGSPVPPQGAAGKGRSNSPAAHSPSQEYTDVITSQEIIDALPPLPQGVTIGVFIKRFQNRIDRPGCMPKRDWIRLVRTHTDYGTDKLLRRKT